MPQNTSNSSGYAHSANFIWGSPERPVFHALVVIGGIELAERIKKRQYKISQLAGRTASMPEIWQAVLVA
jgi:hypothetical protein